MGDFYDELQECMLDGDDELAVEITEKALAEGMEPLDVIQKCMVPILNDIGDQFARLELFLPDLVMAAEVATAVKEVISDKLVKADGVDAGKVVIGTLQGDVHDIGKNIVATLLEVNGYEVFDLGNDVAPQTFVDTARRENVDIIAMSSLLTTSMPFMEDVIKLLKGYNVRDQFSVIVGGGPVNAPWAQSIGADGYSEDANEAIQLCAKIMAERKGA